MKHLNIKATEIFCRLMDSMKANRIIHFDLDNSEKVVLELLEDQIGTARGTGQLFRLYALSKTTDQPNLYMKFIVLDGRATTDKFSQVLIYPASYLQREINTDEVSIIIESGQVISCKEGQQSLHCKYANRWMHYISGHSFFKKQFPQLGPVRVPKTNSYIRPLLDLTNIEKANLLFTLCPDVSRGFLGFVLTAAIGAMENTNDKSIEWVDDTIFDDARIIIATDVKESIESGFTKMAESSAFLAAELFDEDHFPFLLHCLHQYILKARNERFNRGIEFFFDI